MNQTVCRPVSLDRRGIILLVVLGMLTLFSMLGASYLVFTNQQRSAAFSINRAETERVDGGSLLEDSLVNLLVGTNGPGSSLWGHDLLGDLYGIRDAVEGDITAVVSYQLGSLDCAPELLMGNQFVRFPTNLFSVARYPYRRNDVQSERRFPGYPGPYTVAPPDARFAIDDVLVGRLLTFDAGPLEGLTFEIIRSFGDHRNVPIENRGRETLSGQVYLDIRPHLRKDIEIDGERKSFSDWLDPTLSPNFSVHRLFYDNVINATTIASGSPPQPYDNGTFYINGRMLNGPGLGWDVSRTDKDDPGVTGTTDFNLYDRVSTRFNVTAIEDTGALPAPPYSLPNAVHPYLTTPYESSITGDDVPIALQGHYARYRLEPGLTPANPLQSLALDLPPGDTDEPYDAPDYNNLFLSYFPVDPVLGEPTPSFVRPSQINWILNQQSGNNAGSLTAARLRQILRGLQRSTLRPLPIVDDLQEFDPSSPNNNMYSEVPTSFVDRSEGVLQLAYDNFTGSNPNAGFATPISMSSPSAAQVIALAQALAGADTDGDGFLDSWDVDNNGDGVPDSLWIDAGLAIGESESGGLYKPLVSYMVEDLGGRVDVNRAGNLAQARDIVAADIRGALAHANPSVLPATSAATSPLSYTTIGNAALMTPTGFGYGPAEIDVRGLFAPHFAYPGYTFSTLNGPLATAPTAAEATSMLLRGPQRLIRDRLLTLSTSEGAVSSIAALTASRFVAAGELFDPLTRFGNDYLGAIRDPLRANVHDFREAQGLPTDAFGRASIGIDVAGTISVGRASQSVTFGGGAASLAVGDTIDDPYEFVVGAAGNPDSPYSDSELYPLLNLNELDRDLVSSRLIELINDYHSQPPTTAVQRDQLNELFRIFAESVTTSSNSAAVVTGLLPSEWLDAGANLEELRTNPPTTSTSANAASSPQRFILESLNAAIVAAYPAGQQNERDQARNAWLWELLPIEVRAGGRMDLNRPFGNGVNDDDDNGDGIIASFRGTNVADYADVIDDPVEIASGQVFLRYDAVGGPANTNWSSSRGDVTPGEPNANGNGTPNNRDISSRAVFARHLYVLAMLLTRDATSGTDFDFPTNSANTPPFTALAANSRTLAEEYRAWKIAQWAVNIADFRDSDAIMTRFDYDPNPFDGWDVTENSLGRTFRTVWGLEFPELSIEESLAFHDRRVRDTTFDDVMGAGTSTGELRNVGGTERDQDADQYRLPEGSLFLELKSTRSPQPIVTPANDSDPVANPMAFPPELYTNVGSVTAPNWVLDLNRVAPDNNPVWRIAITPGHYEDNPRTGPLDPQNANLCPDFLFRPNGSESGTAYPGYASAVIDRETATLQPNRPQFFGPTTTGRYIDRVIWLSGQDPDSNNDGFNDDWVADRDTSVNLRSAGQIYFYESGSTSLSPGQHLLIAPRVVTNVGETETTDGTTATRAVDGEPLVDGGEFVSTQQIFCQLGQNSSVVVRDTSGVQQQPTFDEVSGAGAPAANASARPPAILIASSQAPVGWTANPRRIGANISEPYEVTATASSPNLTTRAYYTEPTEELNSSRANYAIDSWYDYATGSGGFPDRPFDTRANAELPQMLFDNPGTTQRESQQTGTYDHVKTAYLQRLADPTEPWDAEFNPYISVDYISLDLTLFNGSQDNRAADGDGIWHDDDDRDPFGNAVPEKFASRFKTGMPSHLNVASNPPANLALSINTFAPEVTNPVVPVAGRPTAFFAYDLLTRVDINSLDPSIAADQAQIVVERQSHSTTLGFANQSYGQRWQQGATANASLTPYIGTPFDSFMSNVTWLNRPFVSPAELMWVPSSGPGRLAAEFGVGTVPSGLAANTDRYQDTNNPAATTGVPTDPARFDFNQRYTHLFNFFSDSDSFSGATRSPNFHRLLEMVEVPTPFDSDANFVSPESDPFDTTTNGYGDLAGEQSTVPANSNYATYYDSSATNAFIDGSPLSWNLARPGPNEDRSFVFPTVPNSGSNVGRWQGVTPGSGQTNGFWTNHVAMEPFRPPFSFRSPLFRSGQVNLNTIKTSRVYRSLMYGISDDSERDVSSGFGAFWPEFVNNRRGYALGAFPANIQNLRTNLNPDVPNQMAGVFKPANSAHVRPQTATLTPPTFERLDSTTLRENLFSAGAPLFSRTTSLSPTIDADRSVVHDQLGQTRLANLATSQSNVFAVWITVGLFEVDSATMTVGREVGSDQGEVQRYKAFHIIDRSRPVRYQPGERNNVLDSVKLSRIAK